MALAAYLLQPSVTWGVENVDPAQIERRIEQQTQGDQHNFERDPLLPSATPLTPEPSDRFILTGITVTGTSVFTGQELAPLYDAFLATEVGRAELSEIAAKVTQFYQREGYSLTRAIIPAQSMLAGVVELRVTEGYVENVLFSGDGPHDGLRPYTQQILTERPLTQATFERNLLLMHDLAGVKVSDIALAEEVEGSGVYTLALTIERSSWQSSAYLDNRGSRSVGPLQLGLTTTANNLWGTGEALTASAYTVPDQPQELLYGQLRLLQPIGSSGLALDMSGSYSNTNPSAQQGFSNREGLSLSGTFGLQYPIIRMRNETLWLRGSFDVRNSKDETDFGIISDDRLRVARVKLSYFRIDEWDGVNLVSLGVSQGLDILGASGAGHRWASRFDGNVQFTKLTAELRRHQKLWDDNWALALAASGQKSSTSLLSAEEFGLGGASYGRAYEYGTLTGDNGLAGSAELQFMPPLELPVISDLTLYGFYDIGAVWNRHTIADLKRLSLASAGGGVRAKLFENVSTSIEIAQPLTRDTSVGGDRDPRIYFSIFSEW
ncbi:MAG: ShlB/FhaC/HecB family hemolysin secretion/activation protein [Parvibaculum sp.]